MNVEIEVDEQAIIDAITRNLTASLQYQVKEHVMVNIKNIITQEIRKQAQDHVVEILKDYQLPDGRSFKEFVTDLLTSNKEGYRARPRLEHFMQKTVEAHAQRWWEEVFEEHIPALRDKIREEMLSKTMGALLKP